MRERGKRAEATARAYAYLEDSRDGYHTLTSRAKRAVARRIAQGDLGARAARIAVPPTAFDMVQLPLGFAPTGILDEKQIESLNRSVFKRIRLIEVKSTEKAKDSHLSGQFFSFQYSEQLAAQALGSQYRVVFVGVGSHLRRPFVKELRWDQIWSKARSVHISFSVEFKRH